MTAQPADSNFRLEVPQTVSSAYSLLGPQWSELLQFSSKQAWLLALHIFLTFPLTAHQARLEQIQHHVLLAHLRLKCSTSLFRRDVRRFLRWNCRVDSEQDYLEISADAQ